MEPSAGFGIPCFPAKAKDAPWDSFDRDPRESQINPIDAVRKHAASQSYHGRRTASVPVHPGFLWFDRR